MANGALVWRSDDGRHWTHVDDVAGRELQSVAAGPAGFLAFGFAERKAVALTSIDGRAWSVTEPPTDEPPSGAVVGNLFVTVGVAGYSYEGESHPQPAVWVLDHDSWVPARLPKAVFSEPMTHGQRSGTGQPRLAVGVGTSDGSLLSSAADNHPRSCSSGRRTDPASGGGNRKG